jgi:hypothetical protein
MATEFFRIAEPLLVSVFTAKFAVAASSFAVELDVAFDSGRGQRLCVLLDGVVANMQARRAALRAAFVKVVFEGQPGRSGLCEGESGWVGGWGIGVRVG